jgi:hypothetical protein
VPVRPPCGLDISPGDHLVLTATRTESGSFQPSICSPWAAMNTPEAAKLIAEAESLYGAGVAPSPSTIPLDGPVGGEGSGASSPVVLIGVAAAASGAVLLGLLILVRRRRSDA